MSCKLIRGIEKAGGNTDDVSTGGQLDPQIAIFLDASRQRRPNRHGLRCGPRKTANLNLPGLTADRQYNLGFKAHWHTVRQLSKDFYCQGVALLELAAIGTARQHHLPSAPVGGGGTACLADLHQRDGFRHREMRWAVHPLKLALEHIFALIE